MLDPKEVVQEGYMSLAKRTRQAYETMRAKIGPTHAEDLFSKYQVYLAQIERTGDVKAIGQDGREVIGAAISGFERSIPIQFTPGNIHATLGMADYAMRSYVGFADFNEFKERARISRVEYMEGFSAMGATATERIFYVAYEPKRAAYCVISNIHEMLHALQEDRDIYITIVQELWHLQNFEKLDNRIENTPGLLKRRGECLLHSHVLKFLKSPDMLKLAGEMGVIGLEAYLDQHMDRSNVLISYCEGDAHIRSADVIRHCPQIQPEPLVVDLYALLALTDAISAFSKSMMQRYYWAGVGLAEYIRNHPKKKPVILESQDFHQAFTREFFIRK